jgi:hypothetical protein
VVTTTEWLFEAPVAHHEMLLAETPGVAAPAPAPPIVRSETQPPQQTLYARIPLGGESPAPPLTGIFIPDGYKLRGPVDLVLYLQGHRTQPDAAWFRALTIDQYWNSARFPRWALREATNASGKNVVLVAPTMGVRSQATLFGRRGGLDTYLDQVMAVLAGYGPFRAQGTRPVVGNIILACHSGGGARMYQLVTLGNRLASRVRECWAFDSMYGQGIEDAWYAWAKRHPGARLYVHYGSGGTVEHSRRLDALARCQGVRGPCQRLANVFVEGRTSLPHNNVPIEHWFKRLRAASWLPNK